MRSYDSEIGERSLLRVAIPTGRGNEVAIMSAKKCGPGEKPEAGGFVAHFSTCPDAETWRRKKTAAAGGRAKRRGK